MSIIHDALKKAEELSLKNEAAPEPAFEGVNQVGAGEKPKVYLWYVLGLCLLLFLGNTLINTFNRTNVLPASKATSSFMSLGFSNPFSTASSSPKKSPPDQFSLSGVFFSQDKGFAIINDEVVSEGDTVGKARVLKIGLDEVELENEGKTVKLSALPQ